MNICGFDVDQKNRFFLIAGPCVIENEKIAYQTAEHLKQITDELKINFIYKSSFQKANRSSCNSYQGPGMTDGLNILRNIKEQFKVPILTDVHEDTPLDEVVQVVDMLQTPAFLCRQTNFIKKVAATNLPVNIKKGQFLAPLDMVNVVINAKSTGNQNILVCERGFSFGYNNLIVDMRSLVMLRRTNCPVVFDATHSVQLPGAGGQAEYIEPLAKAAVAVGVAGLFMETHPKPEEALCDGPNSMPLSKMKNLLTLLVNIDNVIKA